ncbi:MAG: hypothetical protein WBF17_07810 [Phycisphaerae bacterium]
MVRRLPAIAAAVLLVGPLAGTAPADLKEAPNGVLVEDFEGGQLDQWGVDERDSKHAVRVPAVLEIARDAGKAALHMKGGFHSRVFCKDRTFRDFSLEVRMRKASGNYAGVVVRDHWDVFFQMRCFLELHCDLKGFPGSLFKSGEEFRGYRDLKVICAGPLLHAYVDGKRIFTHRITPGEGRVGLYAHGGGEAYYDRLRIDTRVAPEHYVLVEPQAPGDCLVFPPERDAALRFKVSNYSASRQQVTVLACVKTWGDTVVRPALTRQVQVAAGEAGTAELDMGRLPAGFYRVELRSHCGGKEVANVDDLPLAVQKRGEGGFSFRAPTIPVAAYYKYFNKKVPAYVNTYAHAAARSLKDHHFNAVVADPSFTRQTVDIFQSYGIATIARGQAFLDHPAVIATLIGDEPKGDEIEKLKQEYQKVRQATSKPATTCLVGEGMGLGIEGGPLWIWRRLQPELRCFRWYGIKKSHYGLLHDVKYKGWLPLSSVLRIAESSSDTPYWFVAPALGKTQHEAYYHKPSPAETTALMHLALAYGADGIIFWSFQTHGSWPCFVEQKSLEPNDGNYAAAGDVAALIEAHADLLAALRLGGLDVRCPSPVVDARPLHDSRVGDRQSRFVYAVNKDTGHRVSTRLLLWAERWKLTSVRDVYSGEKLQVKRDEEGYLTVPLTLAPGEGKLLATDAADAK